MVFCQKHANKVAITYVAESLRFVLMCKHCFEYSRPVTEIFIKRNLNGIVLDERNKSMGRIKKK